MMIKEAINKIVRGNDLTESEMEITMLDVLAGETAPSQVGGLFIRPADERRNR